MVTGQYTIGRSMMKKLFVTIMVSVMAWVGAGMLSPSPVSAACSGDFLTFRPWYKGLIMNEERGRCDVKAEENFGGTDDSRFVASIWIIILNVLSNLFSVVGYLAIGFLIFGGYMYLLARGDPSKIAKGKKTVISAIVGLIVCILASLIANTIVHILSGATGG